MPEKGLDLGGVGSALAEARAEGVAAAVGTQFRGYRRRRQRPGCRCRSPRTCRRRPPRCRPPRLDHVQLGGGAHHGRDRGVELSEVDMPVTHHRQLPRRHPGDVRGGLALADVDPATEHRHAVPAQRITALGIRAGSRAEMVVPAQPAGGARHDRQLRRLRHPPRDRPRHLPRSLRCSRAAAPLAGRHPTLADHQAGVGLIPRVQSGGRVQVRVPQPLRESCGRARQGDLGADPSRAARTLTGAAG